jgi:hypothetical protein
VKQEVNRGDGEPSLAFLIERSADLKRDLVRFARSPRFERSLASMLEAAGPEGSWTRPRLSASSTGSRCSTACRTARP